MDCQSGWELHQSSEERSTEICALEHKCKLLAVIYYGGITAGKGKEPYSEYPYSGINSSGRLEVQILVNPTLEIFCEVQTSFIPELLYFRWEQQEDEKKIDGLVWGTPLPNTVYLEAPNSDNVAHSLRFKGVPFVIYWKDDFSCHTALHFRRALLAVIQSSCSHIWDAYQLAYASFRLHCAHVPNFRLGPQILGDAPKVNIENAPGQGIQIHDAGKAVRILFCGVRDASDPSIFRLLQKGLSALLNIEIRGSKLRDQVSSSPIRFQAPSPGDMTVECDLTTCSSAHPTLLVSGSPQICTNDQLAESYIKKELIEKSKLVAALSVQDKPTFHLVGPSNSAAVACGTSVFEVRMKVPMWAVQVLRDLASKGSYRSFVSLGILAFQDQSVAAFKEDDVDHLLFFYSQRGKNAEKHDELLNALPPLLPKTSKKRRPGFGAGSRKRSKAAVENGTVWSKTYRVIGRPAPPSPQNKILSSSGIPGTDSPGGLSIPDLPAAPADLPTTPHAMKSPRLQEERMVPFSGTPGNDSRESPSIPDLLAAPADFPTTPHSMKSPRLQEERMVPFSGTPGNDSLESRLIPNLLTACYDIPTTLRGTISMLESLHAPLAIERSPLNKHGCSRSPLRVCSKEEFLKDVMDFLILKGHSSLVPRQGISAFPKTKFNTKPVDLYNLYKEVIAKGGFDLDAKNRIDWVREIFPTMDNCTTRNTYTSIANILRKHYREFLLEYESAHDDVCLSNTPGDRVRCCLCNKLTHCDRDGREGIGPVKEFRLDEIDYICPECSLLKKRNQKMVGPSYTSTTSQQVEHHGVRPLRIRENSEAVPVEPLAARARSSSQHNTDEIEAIEAARQLASLSLPLGHERQTYKKQETSSGRRTSFSITECMEEIRKYTDVPAVKRVMAAKTIQAKRWRARFMHMDDETRRRWLNSLEQ